MSVIAIANRHPRLRIDRRAIARAFATLDSQAAKICGRGAIVAAGELSLVFLTDAALAQLHGAFLDDPSTTDVITFAGDSTLGTAGEICVSADRAAAFARAHGGDFSRELTLYLVHGWLHLAGFDDLEPKKKRAMRRAEAKAIRGLEEANALPTFRLNVRAKDKRTRRRSR